MELEGTALEAVADNIQVVEEDNNLEDTGLEVHYSFDLVLP